MRERARGRERQRSESGRRDTRRPQRGGQPGSGGGVRGEWLYGRRPVLEVLRADKRHIYEAVLPEGGRDSGEVAELRGMVMKRGVPMRVVERGALDEICEGGNHQGVALRCGGFPYISLDQIIHDVENDANALVLLLDHIEDPQNVGALLRSAEAVGVTGVVLPEDRAAGITASVVRASAGASEHMRVARVVNMVRAMKQLQKSGVWLTALDFGVDARNYTEVDFKGRVGLIVGSEGAGVSRLVRESSDFVASLPMLGQVGSLNASVAGAVALYEVLRQRQG